MSEEIIARYRIELDKLKGDVTELKKQFGLAEKAAEESAGKASGSFNQIGATLKNVGIGIAAAFSVKKIVDFGLESIKAFQEAEKNARKLQVAVGVNGGLTSDFERLIKQSAALQKIGIFSDDDIQNAQTMALQFGLSSDAVEKLTPIILDFASATGQDLTSATQAVILGVEGSERALKKFGVQVDSEATRQDRFASIMDQLNKKFEGQAKIIGETSSGAAARLKNAFDDLKESVGQTLIPIVANATEGAAALLRMTEVSESGKLEKERRAFEDLSRQVFATTQGSKERVEMVKHMQDIYPDFLKNISAEKVTNEQLAGAIKGVNNQYAFKIASASGQETLEKSLTKEGKSAAELEVALSNLNHEIETVVQLGEKHASSSNKNAAAELQFQSIYEQGKALYEGKVKFDNVSSVSLAKLGDAYNVARDAQLDYASATFEASAAQVEFEKTVKRLRDIFSIPEDKKKGAIDTGLGALTDEEKAKIAARAKAKADAATKQAEEEAKAFKERSEKEFKQDEDNVQRESAMRIVAMNKMNLTQEEYQKQITLLEMFELVSRLENFGDYGKDVGEIQKQIAIKQREIDNNATSSLKTVGKKDHEDFMLWLDDMNKADALKKQTDEDKKDILLNLKASFEEASSVLNQINQDRVQSEIDQSDLNASEEERKLKEQYDQRLIGQDEYQNKLKAIKDKQVGHRRELDAKLRALQNRQAIFDKASALFQIGLATREAIMKITKTYASNPILMAVLIAATAIFSAAQAAAVLSANPPAAHEGERFVTRRKGDKGSLKSDETLRTLRVGERVVRAERNRENWNLYEAIEEGSFEKYVFKNFVAPALAAQNKKSAKQSARSFAENVSNSFMMQGSATDAISERVFQKLWSKGIKITNLDQLQSLINTNSNPYRKILN